MLLLSLELVTVPGAISKFTHRAQLATAWSYVAHVVATVIDERTDGGRCKGATRGFVAGLVASYALSFVALYDGQL